MAYSAQIRYPDASGRMFKALSPEGDAKWERSSLTISRKKGFTEIKILAKDHTALKSTLWPMLKNAELCVSMEKDG